MSYLTEIQKEFDVQYGMEVDKVRRPYHFIKFESFLQKTKQLYSDTRSQRNLSKVEADLSDAHRIITNSLSQMLERGEKMSTVTQKSDELLAEAVRYEKMAKNLNRSMFFRKYGPFIAVGGFFVFLMLLRYYIF